MNRAAGRPARDHPRRLPRPDPARRADRQSRPAHRPDRRGRRAHRALRPADDRPDGQTIPLIADFRIQLASRRSRSPARRSRCCSSAGRSACGAASCRVGLYLLLGLFLPVYAGGRPASTRSCRATPAERSSSGRPAATSSGSSPRRRSRAGWRSSAGTGTILGAVAAMLIGNVVIYLVGVPWLAMALGVDARDGDRVRADAVPRRRRDQAAARGGRVPRAPGGSSGAGRASADDRLPLGRV